MNEITITLTPALTSMAVIATTKDAVYVRLPRELQRPIDGGCGCDHCKANPELAKWDTLVVPTPAFIAKCKRTYSDTHTWTVHMPDAQVGKFIEYVRIREHARKDGK